jgi:hypothetical protein
MMTHEKEKEEGEGQNRGSTHTVNTDPPPRPRGQTESQVASTMCPILPPPVPPAASRNTFSLFGIAMAVGASRPHRHHPRGGCIPGTHKSYL